MENSDEKIKKVWGTGSWDKPFSMTSSWGWSFEEGTASGISFC